MNFGKHHSNNVVLAAPTEPTGAIEVSPLNVTRSREHGVMTTTSFWYPTPEEMRLIAEGHPITVSVLGEVFYPLYVGVQEE